VCSAFLAGSETAAPANGLDSEATFQSVVEVGVDFGLIYPHGSNVAIGVNSATE
jgi:hypothetical protein